MAWKLWLYGLITGFISAAATAASNVFVLPMIVNGMTMRTLLIATGWNAVGAGVIGTLAYLKTHPVPEWAGAGRRADDTTGKIVVVPASDGKDATKP